MYQTTLKRLKSTRFSFSQQLFNNPYARLHIQGSEARHREPFITIFWKRNLGKMSSIPSFFHKSIISSSYR